MGGMPGLTYLMGLNHRPHDGSHLQEPVHIPENRMNAKMYLLNGWIRTLETILHHGLQVMMKRQEKMIAVDTTLFGGKEESGIEAPKSLSFRILLYLWASD